MNERKKNNRQFYREPFPTNASEVRVPPQDLEAEQAVLGSMMLDSKAIHIAQENISETDFYREAHRKIFEAIVDLNEDKKPVDILTLSARLRDMGEFETVGGVTALTTLVERTPTSANVEHYAKIVKEKAQLRRLITAGSQVVADAYAEESPVKEICENAEKRIFEATEVKGGDGFVEASTLLGETIEEVDKISKENIIPGIPSGFSELDELTGGFRPGELILIAARTSVGKTSLSLQWAANQSAGNTPNKKKYQVGFYSIEMKKKEMMFRLTSNISQVSLKRMRNGGVTSADMGRLVGSSGKFHGMKLYLNDTASINIHDLTSKARRLKYEKGIEILYVDYLQKINYDKADTDQARVSYISRKLKDLAMDLNIPIVGMSQLSRPEKGKEDKEPVLSDLRESGALEQDADMVIFIHRTKTGEIEVAGKRKKIYEHKLMLEKQRSGEAGEEVKLFFQKWCCRFWQKADHDKALAE